MSYRRHGKGHLGDLTTAGLRPTSLSVMPTATYGDRLTATSQATDLQSIAAAAQAMTPSRSVPVWVWVGGGATIVAGIAGVLLWRRRRRAKEQSA